MDSVERKKASLELSRGKTEDEIQGYIRNVLVHIGGRDYNDPQHSKTSSQPTTSTSTHVFTNCEGSAIRSCPPVLPNSERQTV